MRYFFEQYAFDSERRELRGDGRGRHNTQVFDLLTT